MKKYFLFLFSCIYGNLTFSQVTIKPSVGIYQSGTFPFSMVVNEFLNVKETIDDAFISSTLKAGIELDLKTGSIDILGIFKHSGTVRYGSLFSHIYDKNNQFLGGAIKYKYNLKKIKRPFYLFTFISSLANISTNYQNTYLNEGYGTTNSIPLIFYTSSEPSSGLKKDYASWFYCSTPFTLNLSFGIDFQLIKGLFISLSAGYEYRYMRTKYAEWGEGEDVNEKLRTISSTKHYFHMLDVQLGLSYTFNFHKDSPQPQ